jgi:hypothetical protein
MHSLPPLQVTVDTRGWSVILDVRLALHRLGPMLALRLAEELRVFLVPALWEVLDNTVFYEQNPRRLTDDNLGYTQAVAGPSGALEQWETARLELGLSALRVFWAGDALHDSSLPKDMDAGVAGRFDRLARSLSQRLEHARPDLEAGWPLLDGSRDAAALSAAMMRYRPLILTLADSQGGTPALCRLLSVCGVPCRNVESDAIHMRACLNPILARSGSLELGWDGLRLAVVHLVTPRTLLMSPLSGEEHLLLDDEGDGPDGWQEAAAYWYALP